MTNTDPKYSRFHSVYRYNSRVKTSISGHSDGLCMGAHGWASCSLTGGPRAHSQVSFMLTGGPLQNKIHLVEEKSKARQAYIPTNSLKSFQDLAYLRSFLFTESSAERYVVKAVDSGSPRSIENLYSP